MKKKKDLKRNKPVLSKTYDRVFPITRKYEKTESEI